MGMIARFDRWAPDVAATARRFWFAIALVTCGTALALLVINDILPLSNEVWPRGAIGLFTAAVFAVAGVLFKESGDHNRYSVLAVAYVVPVVAGAALLVNETRLLFPFLLPIVGVLWLSVSAFARIGDPEGADVENRFWWLNQRAAITAAVGIAAVLIVGLGMLAIERSLSVLFGLASDRLFYSWLFPFAALFLAPVYWLSTLPRLGDYDARQFDEPDFLSRAIGFLGQFVLTPLLLVYGAILLAYTAQIAVDGALPQGMLGWMVLGFVVIGAANWLVLHPPFMRRRALVAFFRASWFWLTVVPLALFALAVWVRIEAYGLTSERMMLIAGGVWAAALTLLYLTGRGDIRLVPGLAGLVLVLFSVGPWNIDNAPRADQSARLSSLLAATPVDAEGRYVWTPERAAVARSAIDYLATNGERELRAVIVAHGRTLSFTEYPLTSAYAALDLNPEEQPEPHRSAVVVRGTEAVDVSLTPFFIVDIRVSATGNAQVNRIAFSLDDNVLTIQTEGRSTSVPLADWLLRQEGRVLVDPWIDFQLDGVAYRLAVNEVTYDIADERRAVSSLHGVLFAGTMPTPTR